LLNDLADKKARTALENPTDVDSNGLLINVIVQPVEQDTQKSVIFSRSNWAADFDKHP
jgi:hypothetical protein